MERSVGRQPAHVDNDRREQGCKLYIPRRVHAGDIEQSDGDKSYLRRQWDYRHSRQNRQHDSICNVTQSAGRRDSSTDEAVELSRKVALLTFGSAPLPARVGHVLVVSAGDQALRLFQPRGLEHGRDRGRDHADVTVGRPAQVVRSADGLRRAGPKTGASAVIGVDGRPWKTSAGLSRRGRRDDARRIMARSPMRVRREVASPQRDRRYQILP